MVREKSVKSQEILYQTKSGHHGKRKLVFFQLLSYSCFETINVPWLFLTLPRVGLQCVIVVFPDHTHLLFLATN